MTTPNADRLNAAAEALRALPGLGMKSKAQRLEIVRVVVEAYRAAKPRSIADLGKDGDGDLPVYGSKP